MNSVNNGAVFHYLTKPWDPELLEGMVKRWLEYFAVQIQRDRLLHEKLGIVQNMLRGDRAESMSILASGLNHHMRNALTSGIAVQDVFQSTLAMMEVEFEQRGVVVSLDIPADLPAITSNRVKLGQLFRLLLQDELVHLRAGQQVFLGVEEVAGHPGESSEPCLHLWMGDDGPSVDESALDHLFDPFFQRGDDPRDLGTNLMAAYHIVHLHGGHIEARNDFQGARTAIHIYLPLSQSASQTLSSQDLNSRIVATESLWRGLQRS